MNSNIRICITIILSVIMINVTGQKAEQTYIPMLDSNSTWTSSYRKFTDAPINIKYEYTAYNIKMKPDSTIDNVVYGKVYQNSIAGNNDYGVFGYCIEKDNKVFFSMEKTKVADRLIYDFNAKISDTLIVYSPFSPIDETHIKGIVDSVSTVSLGGIQRKVIYFSPKFGKARRFYLAWRPISKTQIKWVEGIGAIDDDLFSTYPSDWITGGMNSTFPVVCYVYNKELIFQNKTFPSCNFRDWVMAVNYKNKTTATLKIYPNPTSGMLRVHTSLPILKLAVYQNNGTKLIDSFATESLDVSALPQGLYLLEAIDEQGNRYTSKFEKE